MNWERSVQLSSGDRWKHDTDLGTLSLDYDIGTFQGILSYSRPGIDGLDEDEDHQETIMLEGSPDPITIDFVPLYPDRPIVFELEDPLKVPPEQKGFFFVSFRVAIGITIRSTETVVEHLLPKPRKKSYWGPPNDGLSTYYERTPFYRESHDILTESDTSTAILPVHYYNAREENERVQRCLVPLDELDLYRNEEDDLVFEVIRLHHEDEYVQKPSPRQRAPHELEDRVDHFLDSPSPAKTLFEKVTSLPRLNDLTSIFLNR